MWITIEDSDYTNKNGGLIYQQINEKGQTRKITITKFSRNKKRPFYDSIRILNKQKNKMKTYLIHRLVAKYFLPNPKNKSFVNHKDGNKSNNTLENLEWVTPKENIHHGIKKGLIKPFFTYYDNRGMNSFSSKLNDKQVKYIKTSNESGVKLAKKFNITTSAISLIRTNKTWKHI